MFGELWRLVEDLGFSIPATLLGWKLAIEAAVESSSEDLFPPNTELSLPVLRCAREWMLW